MMNAIADRPVRKKEILIVDDNPDNLRLLKRILSTDMYAVHEALSGEAALRFVQSTLPDIVVLDVMMPDIDGYQVCDKLKHNRRTQGIPVVFIGYGDQIAEKSKAFEMGGVDFITKPFQEEEVLLRLKAHLDLYDRQKLLEQRVAERTAAVEQLVAQLDRERQEHEELQQRLAVLESVANFPLIESKLTPPQLSDYFFRIDRLERNFEQACGKRLVSVVAPAGYGKSTTLARLRLHVESKGWIVGWISLDSEHDEPARFLHYLVAALQGAAVRAGAPVLTPPVAGASADRQLRALCADLAEFRQVVALFLEDYHLITDPAVHEIVNWLVAAGPPCLKLFIASRARLPLKLSKLKLANELYALSAADMCLRLDEVGPFVEAVSGQKLEPAQSGLLYHSTEGWPAGLQLASLALKGGEHVSDVIEGIAGGESDIAAYIGEMVLVQMPPRLAEFLCLTALFTRFSLTLCEQFFPPREARELLDQVKAQNLFLIALDAQQEWFRYHPLFCDYLKSRFLLRDGEQVKAAYLKASAWFVQQDLMREAISYALAGGDYAGAADRASRYAFTLARKHGDYATVISWIRQLPPQYVAQRPHLQLAFAWAQVFSLHFPEAEVELANIERLLASGEMARRMGFNEAHIRSVEKKLMMVRSVYFAMMDRTELAGPLCLEWMARWGQGDPIDILTIGLTHAYVVYRTHDLEGAKRCVADTGRRIENAGSVWGKCWIEGLGAVVACDCGDVPEAEGILERSRAAAVKSAGAQAPGPRMLAALYAAVRYEQDRLSEAEAMLEQSWPVEAEHGWVESHVAYYRTKARLLHVRGRQSEADACLAGGVAQAERLGLPRMALWLASERISLQLAAGAAVQAARTAAVLRSHYQAALDLDEQLEFRIAEIRARIAAGQIEQTMQPLNRLLVTARHQGSVQALIQTICLKAALLSQCGKWDEALRTLDEALALGLAGGLCRTLVDEGERIGPLLRQMLARRDTAGAGAADAALSYLRRIVGVLDGHGANEPVRPPGLKSLQIGGDAFSERELQIIRLIATGLGNRETAAQLFLSEATIKWHLQNIYAKLKVGNRAGAIARARELRLV